MHIVLKIKSVLSVLTAGIDYNQFLDPMSITIRSDTKLDCANVSIIEDDLVEGRELFEVYFLIDDFDGSYSLIGSNLTIVTILDSNGMLCINKQLICAKYFHFHRVFCIII